ncbi:MAG: ribulose-phosphate 3-epimerase [Bacillota bacterium]|nr:ribulose-phosphate 3-epimerase [Clostridiales bacterium]MDD6764878.1 ribulose-phosphate 3-epimerase [Bacillota bacterium]MDD6979737.1 ribulose-phosphate 3-epimerase [Bacillota bacterium]MDO4471775.1 ribulose-phosphate 3-epimerase [Bacillota bacterium]MDY6174119.1 ribulose-phosphate 3-epimerase [Lentihominibacter sp.]
MRKLAPSILSADFGRLAEEVAQIERGGADLVHVDVMDGHFVPNISFGAPVMKCLTGRTGLPFDVHLMIENPDAYLEDFVTPQTEYITVHQEACTHLNRTVQHIKSLGIKAGVSINPATSPSVLDYILEDVDMVLLMSVNPGFGGQKFIPSVLEKARKLRDIKIDRGLDFEIEIDGGATLDNVREIIDAGVEIVVAGSAVFKAPDIAARTAEFKEIVK